jgi:hypothetical protein
MITVPRRPQAAMAIVDLRFRAVMVAQIALA